MLWISLGALSASGVTGAPCDEGFLNTDWNNRYENGPKSISNPCAACLLKLYYLVLESPLDCNAVGKNQCDQEQNMFDECMGNTTWAYDRAFFTQNIMQVSPMKRFNLRKASNAALPVVFMHGMGDAGDNPGMKSICQSVSDAYPGTHVNCLNVANGAASISTVMKDQLEEFVQAIHADEKLSGGFNAVGMSQGNLLIRSYIEMYNDPPVHTFISMVGPHDGVADCPDNFLFKIACQAVWSAPYDQPIVFSDYWKDPTDKTTYLEKSRFLADINNEKVTKNASYADHMKSLKNYVLVEATKDTMVRPHVSEQHGFYQWGAKTTLESMKDTEGYKGDWIGLKSLDENRRLHTYSYEGDHMRWSEDFWTNTILPFLKPQVEEIIA